MERNELTARERDILALVAGGRSDRQIAAALGLSHGTVSNYIVVILRRLSAANRTEAVVSALRDGLITPRKMTPEVTAGITFKVKRP